MKTSQRLDVFLSAKYKISRTAAKQKIENGLITVNQKIVTRPNYAVSENDLIDCNQNDIKNNEQLSKKNNELKPWKKNLKIVYEDDYIFVIDKPNNIIVHPTNYVTDKTLANIIKYLFEVKNIKTFGDKLRMGIVHRLDKDTTGLIIVAKNEKSYNEFVNLFISKKIIKKYLALLHGHLKTKTVEVQAPIKRIDNTNKREVSKDLDAKEAITIFKEIKKYNNFTLAEVELLTGRTHQIRVHAEFIKNNVINDPVYGVKHINKTTNFGQYLMASELSFNHPFLKKEIKIKLDLPKEFKEYIDKYGK
ncbi:MAG: RluA family pseudouridine synthase [Malacoplasma sp.]|nr:RluA family pseudouridine synthase [Malacoplasma sp.]